MSNANGTWYPVASKSVVRIDHPLGEGFADAVGPKHVQTVTRRRYNIVLRDGFSRFTWVYLLCHKSDAACIRTCPRRPRRRRRRRNTAHRPRRGFTSDNLAAICDRICIHRKNSKTDVPALYGVVELGFSTADVMQKAACIEALNAFAESGTPNSTDDL